jgi:hypothetical protein
MQANSDLTELLAALNAEGARYLIVGAYAVGLHGRPRATKDADLFVGSDPSNAERVWNALARFGAPLSGVTIDDLATPGTFYIMGRAPNQIDIITEIDGVDFDRAFKNKVTSSYGGVPAFFISKEDLLANKRAAGRPQDLADVAFLESLD